MFKIRDEQLVTMGRENYLKRLIKFLHEEFPESKEIDKNEFRHEIEKQISKAHVIHWAVDWQRTPRRILENMPKSLILQARTFSIVR